MPSDNATQSANNRRGLFPDGKKIRELRESAASRKKNSQWQQAWQKEPSKARRKAKQEERWKP